MSCSDNDSKCITCATNWDSHSWGDATPATPACIACIENAHLDDDGTCTCDIDSLWSGDMCETFVGTCSDVCDGCFGPTIYDCVRCATNAYREHEDACVCMPGYSIEASVGCTWSEGCYQHCNTCTGPGPLDCV